MSAAWLRWGEPSLVTICLVIVYDVLVRLDLLPRDVFTTVDQTYRATTSLLVNPAFWYSLRVTCEAWAVGMVIAILIGVPLGMMIGASRRLNRLFRLSINMIRPIPAIAAMPLLLLLLGVGVEMGAFLVALSAVWPLTFQGILGVQAVDGVAVDMARVYGLGRRQRFLSLVLPSALPAIATGLRLSAIIGLILAVAASLVGGGPGIGSTIAIASQNGNMAQMWALVIICGALGLLVTLTLINLENRYLRWHPSKRAKQK